MKRQTNFFPTVFIAVFAFVMASCDGKSKFVFDSSQDAVKACRDMLTELRGTEKADIKKLTSFVSDWRVLQDTVMQKLSDDDVEKTKEMAEDFFIVADSIKLEIKRVAHSQERSLNDVLYLRLNSTMDMHEWIDKRTFGDARDFFADLDKAKTFPTLETTLKEYYELLNNSGKFQKEGEMLEFIAKEDRCFRSLMQHTLEVKQKDLQQISNMTSEYFDKLSTTVAKNINDDKCKRISLYLTMRINRRVVQNAEACRQELKKKPTLNRVQMQNFKWMIVQPFFSLDDYSAALVTDEQKKLLDKLATDLPELMAYIDGINLKDGKKKDQEDLIGALNEYFLNSFLNFNL